MVPGAARISWLRVGLPTPHRRGTCLPMKRQMRGPLPVEVFRATTLPFPAIRRRSLCEPGSWDVVPRMQNHPADPQCSVSQKQPVNFDLHHLLLSITQLMSTDTLLFLQSF